MSKADAVKFTLKCQNWPQIVVPIAKKQRPAKIVLRNGISLAGNGVHWYDVNDVFFKHKYNPEHLLIEKNDIVVDIGANIGVFSIYAASLTQNTVYAFEPTPLSFESLQRNVKANKLPNVLTFNAAISDKVGSLKLFFDPQDTLGTSNAIIDDANLEKLQVLNGSAEEFIEVPSDTLQNVMDNNNIEQLDFLKLDCEGSEGIILESTPDSYLKRIRKITMEYHDHLSKINHHDMRKMLEKLGFITAQFEETPKLGYLYGWKN